MLSGFEGEDRGGREFDQPGSSVGFGACAWEKRKKGESPHSVSQLGARGAVGADDDKAVKDATTVAVVERLLHQEKTEEREGESRRWERVWGCYIFLGATASTAVMACLATLLCGTAASVLALAATTTFRRGPSCAAVDAT